MALNNISKLDLAFICDCTGSMMSYITAARENIYKIADEIKKKEACDLRVAFIAYRDHPPQENSYITDVSDFSDDIAVAKSNIAKATAMGGGDFPEAVCCGLYDSLYSISWRDDAVKICILIADAPPHGLGAHGDCMDNGCPDLNDPVEIAHKMAEKSITLYCAGCEPSLTPFRQFFIALTLITGGQYVPLDNADKLAQVIVGGTREEISMEKLMAQVHDEVMKEAADNGKQVDEDVLTKRIHDLLNSQGTKLSSKVDTDIKIEENVKEMSKMKTLDDLRKFARDNKIQFASSPLCPVFSSARFTGTSSGFASPGGFGGFGFSHRFGGFGKKKKDYDPDFKLDDDDEDHYSYRGYGKRRRTRGRVGKKPTASKTTTKKAAAAAAVTNRARRGAAAKTVPSIPVVVAAPVAAAAPPSDSRKRPVRACVAAKLDLNAAKKPDTALYLPSSVCTKVDFGKKSESSRLSMKAAAPKTITSSTLSLFPSTLSAPTFTTAAASASTALTMPTISSISTAAAATADSKESSSIVATAVAESINMDQARRLVKKAIARNKLN